MEPNESLKTKQGIEMLKNVRRICAPLPEVMEIIDGFGHTTFKVKEKSFIIMSENEGNARLSFKSDQENQEILLQQGRFIKTPYIGRHGWVSTMNGEPMDWGALEGLIKEAYLRAAPKRLIKQLQL